MNSIHEKAQTLIEALPYIQKFANKKVVVKYGGSAMLNAELEADVIRDVALLKLVGMQPIIVHGGGKEISQWVKLLGKEPEFVNGLRVTDKETMEVAEMVLLKVNKHLVGMLEKTGVKACGICGKDGGTLVAKKKLAGGKDIGFVGDITKVDTTLIDTLIKADVIPVIAPIALDQDGQPYNINADDAAYAVATAVGAEKLAFLTDVEGIYETPSDPNSLISMLTISQAEELIAKGSIGQGMLPKLNNCIDAVKNGVSRVHILDGRVKHCLLLEFYTNSGVGTAILKEEDA